MVKINKNYRKIPNNYLFVKIAQKANEWESKNPERKIIRIGIGDTILPLPTCVAEAMKKKNR